MKHLNLLLLLSTFCSASHPAITSQQFLENKAKEIATKKKITQQLVKDAHIALKNELQQANKERSFQLNTSKKIIDTTCALFFQQALNESMAAQLNFIQKEVEKKSDRLAPADKKAPKKIMVNDLFETMRNHLEIIAADLKTFFKLSSHENALKDYYTALANVIKRELENINSTNDFLETNFVSQQASALKNQLKDPIYTNNLRVLQTNQQRIEILLNRMLSNYTATMNDLFKPFQKHFLDSAKNNQILENSTILKNALSPHAMQTLFSHLAQSLSPDSIFTMLTGESNPYSTLGLQVGPLSVLQIEKRYQKYSRSVPQEAFIIARERLIHSKPLIDSIISFAYQLAQQASTIFKEINSAYTTFLTSSIEIMTQKNQPHTPL